MNRVALFAHFDAQNEIKAYVTFYLDRLRASCKRIVFVTTARPSPRELDKVRPLVDEVLQKENVGLDFGMWRHALERETLDDCDELVLANSSSFGPIFPLPPIFEKMSRAPGDFWSMTDSFEHTWHLQSYFLVFKRAVLSSAPFREFWQSVLPYRDKAQIIFSYELGLTQFLVEQGFRAAAFTPIESWGSPDMRKGRCNPTVFHPAALLQHGMPFVKVHLLRDNYGRIDLRPVRQSMREAGYDESLIQFDAAPLVRPRSYLRRLAGLITSSGS